jgi:hypothetical protein
VKTKWPLFVFKNRPFYKVSEKYRLTSGIKCATLRAEDHMGKKPRAEKTKRIHITIPVEVIETLEFYLFDPRLGRPRYGAISHLTEQLLRQLTSTIFPAATTSW